MVKPKSALVMQPAARTVHNAQVRQRERIMDASEASSRNFATGGVSKRSLEGTNESELLAQPVWLEGGSGLSDVVRRPSLGITWALSFLALGLAARLLLDPWLAPSAFLTFYPAVVAAGLLCGWRRGAVVLLLSAVLAHYFFIDPRWSWSFRDGAAAVLIGFYLSAGALMLWLIAALREAVRRLDGCIKLQATLFQELQHRVANNMHLVTSTLNSAGRRIHDPAAREVIAHAAARVGSLAKLHRRLYDPSAYANGLEAVLRDILAEAFNGVPVEVDLKINVGPLSVRAMTALVLLINEAALNACKHVFIPCRGTRFAVHLSAGADGRMELTVRDDGPGFAEAAPGCSNGQRLGMTIMQGFARQLGGTLQRLEGPGAGLRLAFEAC